MSASKIADAASEYATEVWRRYTTGNSNNSENEKVIPMGRMRTRPSAHPAPAVSSKSRGGDVTITSLVRSLA